MKAGLPPGARVIFVYGTLRRGEGNHELLGTSTFLGEARTVLGFHLRDLGAFPGMFRGGSGTVAGELYAVDAATLAALDRLEDHPDFFQRTEVALSPGGTADAYLLASAHGEGCPHIPSGDWLRRS